MSMMSCSQNYELHQVGEHRHKQCPKMLWNQIKWPFNPYQNTWNSRKTDNIIMSPAAWRTVLPADEMTYIEEIWQSVGLTIYSQRVRDQTQIIVLSWAGNMGGSESVCGCVSDDWQHLNSNANTERHVHAHGTRSRWGNIGEWCSTQNKKKGKSNSVQGCFVAFEGLPSCNWHESWHTLHIHRFCYQKWITF